MYACVCTSIYTRLFMRMYSCVQLYVAIWVQACLCGGYCVGEYGCHIYVSHSVNRINVSSVGYLIKSVNSCLVKCFPELIASWCLYCVQLCYVKLIFEIISNMKSGTWLADYDKKDRTFHITNNSLTTASTTVTTILSIVALITTSATAAPISTTPATMTTDVLLVLLLVAFNYFLSLYSHQYAFSLSANVQEVSPQYAVFHF